MRSPGVRPILPFAAVAIIACAAFFAALPLSVAPAWASNPLTQARVQVREAEYYQRNGDYPSAIRDYQSVISGYPGSLEARDAMLGLSQAHFLGGDYQAAIRTLDQFLESFPGDENVDRAIFFIANNYGRLGNWSMAIAYYELYLNRQAGPLAGYASLYAGDAYFQLQAYDKAIAHLRNALSAGVPRVPAIDAMEKIADSYFATGSYKAAGDWYERVLDRARVAGYRADIQFRLGKAYAALGSSAQAKETWQEVIESYPETTHALSALGAISDGNPPTYYHRGLVYYHNDRYEAAIAAFDRYLVDHPQGEFVPKALYYRALSHGYNGDYDLAIGELADVARAYAGSTVGAEALWQSGLMLERSSRHYEAALSYTGVATQYPGEDFAQDAVFRLGLCYYKQSDYRRAKEAWDYLLYKYPSTRTTAQALFWMGKMLRDKMADPGRATAYFDQVALAESWDYYGLRGNHLGRDEADLFSKVVLAERSALVTESPEEKGAFEKWLATWSGRPFYSFDPDNPMLREDRAFRRAEELAKVGLRREVGEEFWELLANYSNDPVALYELASFLRQNGLYHLSITTANSLVGISPTGRLVDVPKYLQKLVYPVYFAEVLTSESRKAGLDPLLLAAVIRQESKFDQFAESIAKARGLTQVMPSTARGIAEALSVTDFNPEDIFKPYISVAFGAYYLGQHVRQYDGSATLALAAYNAGGGSVGKWTNGNAQVDTDLFVEDIRFAETKFYVKTIYRQYDLYRQIYAPRG
ncbi:MAG: tetratricopeptide repeat protein [Chloroflexi bacterium]|nr:tetratricopeptide repeat protein [Chloroflexota bacterium]